MNSKSDSQLHDRMVEARRQCITLKVLNENKANLEFYSQEKSSLQNERQCRDISGQIKQIL